MKERDHSSDDTEPSVGSRLKRLRRMIKIYFSEEGASINGFLEGSRPQTNLWNFINSTLPTLGLTFVGLVQEIMGFTPPTIFPKTLQEIFAYSEQLIKEKTWTKAIEWISRGLEMVKAHYVIPLIQKHFKHPGEKQAQALFTCFTVHLVGRVELESIAPQLSGYKQSPTMSGRSKIIVVGGIGSLSNQYKALCAEKGWELIYIENNIKKMRRRKRSDNRSVIAILIIVGANSHPLEGAAKEIAEKQKIPVFYLRSQGSVNGIREMINVISATIAK